MKGYFNRKRCIALFMALVFGTTNLVPIQSWALTSGPSQPEMSSFQPAGVSDMVDLFGGDFKYNVPLLEVDGYPVNLAYQSGVGIDDEASWVGLGWNLNMGSINRQLRGIPDDFSGDQVKNDFYTKPKVTIGGTVFVKPEIKGKLAGSLSGTLSLGVFNDNYTGIGATIGANAGLTIGLINGSDGTSGLGLNAGLGISSSTQTGVDVTPSLSLSLNNKLSDNHTSSLSMSATLGYNTRSGLKHLTLSQSFSVTGNVVKKEEDMLRKLRGSSSLDLGGSSYTFNTDPFYPKPLISYKTSSGSFTPSIGGSAFLGFIGGGGTGYVNVREVKEKKQTKPAYGFLYAERGKNRPDALMDFTREKDNPVIPELPNLALPVHTPDLFSFSSQAGAGQFRLYRGGSGVLFDNQAQDVSSSATLGFDIGFGAIFHGGVSFYKQNSVSATQKWTKDNTYAIKGDFQENGSSNPNEDAVFFKQVGEKTIGDQVIENTLQNETPIAVAISSKQARDEFRSAGGTISPIRKTTKAVRRAAIGYLTAEEASKGGSLDKLFKRYDFLPLGFQPSTSSPAAAESFNRISSDRLKHHISEFKVTDEAGKRMVYGLPVYNTKQIEYTFAVGKNPSVTSSSNQVAFNSDGGEGVDTKNKGVDWYYTRQQQPPYATSYLLTGILSPDYVDLKQDGITDDDRGTAIKFNYSKLSYPVKWRTPVSQANMASYSRALLADDEDDKGSIVYGEKEVWYVHSVETRTKVAYFILEDRNDALGVADWKGGIDINNKQKCLKKIVLYSKADLTKPIKTVHFTYSYRLCAGVLNSSNGGGKLTLDRIHFTYGNSPKGSKHYYEFDYKNDANYQYIASDRWGTYKANNAHQGTEFAALTNDEFPYTLQDKTKADSYSSQWLLNKIKLPSGGEINVHYESDDYAYVQNKRAMKMVKPDALANNSNATVSSLIDAKKLVIPVPVLPPSSENTIDKKTRWFKKTYLNSSDYIFGKLFVKIAKPSLSSPGNMHDFVVGYAKVLEVDFISGKAYIRLEDISEGNVSVNPYSISAWQKMRMEYPKYAYPGYENRPNSSDPMSNFTATISAIFNAFKTLGELKDNFYERAKRKGFASEVDLSKSFFRLTEQTGKKLGGGCRVKKITITDNWQEMVGSGNGISSSYGMEYAYTTVENGNTISSGVASFEPSLGNEENPFRQPVPYLQKIKGALNNLFYLEQPFGESYFPAPSVGYSKITVHNIDESGSADPENETGWTTTEFYTAREFPTLMSTTPMQKFENGPRTKSNLFGGFQIHELVLSQGYAIYLNDMHGKTRAEKVFDKNGSLISSSEFLYNATQIAEGEWKLNNNVQVIEENGSVSNRYLGRDIEVYVDMRESEFSNYGESINLGVDVIPFIWGALPIPHWPVKNNDEYRLFRSASVVKVVQAHGIMQKVVKVQHGSQVTAENLAFDPNTGDVLITKSHNEFKQSIYTVSIPAYWVYKRMGASFKTLNTIIKLLNTDANGVIMGSYASFLQPGDELLAWDGRLLWVVENKEVINGVEPTNASKRLVDKNGNLVSSFIGSVKVIRSGNKNLISASTSSIVCMESPIVNGRLKLMDSDPDGDHNDLKIIDAKTSLFSEDWSGDWDFPCATCPPGYVTSADGEWCELVPQEDFSQCFSLCAGGFDPNSYNIEGAYIKEYPGSAWVNRKSLFWGGVSCYCQSKGPGDILSKNIISRKPTRTDSTKAPVGSNTEVIRTDATEPVQNEVIPPQCNNTNTTIPCNRCGGLQRSGVWFCRILPGNSNINLPYDQWIGIETYVEVPTTKTYYIGYGVDNSMRLYVNNSLVVSLNNANESNFRRWEVVPITLYAGKNLIKIEGKNVYVSGANFNPASMGVEIYDNTYQQLINEQMLHIRWATNQLLYTNKRVYTYVINANGTITGRYHCNGAKPDILTDLTCDRVRRNQLNPYVKGFKGNWRPIESKVYQVNRSYGNQATPAQAGINIPKDGHYQNFVPYWLFSNQQWNASPDSRWATSSTITLYDRFGQELENKNALNKYSAASFAFLGNVTNAVGSNARHREIFYESFEDLKFRQTNRSKYAICDSVNTFKMDGYVNNVTGEKSHTGKYSLQLNTNVSISAKLHSKDHLSEPYFAISNKGEYLYKNVPGLYYNGFEPMPSKAYLLSCWVKDNNPASKAPPITVYNGGFVVQLSWKATVEGWKLFEGVFTTSSSTLNFFINGNSSIYLDDLRIMPNDGEMKSYAYDESNYRLMAELDENNFATFYEYDDEGVLNRVKKETEKGIMTIRETRSTYKRKL